MSEFLHEILTSLFNGYVISKILYTNDMIDSRREATRSRTQPHLLQSGTIVRFETMHVGRRLIIRLRLR